MLRVSHITNGTGKVSMVVHDNGRQHEVVSLTAEEAIDLAAVLLLKARNLMDGIHDSTDEARVITTKKAAYPSRSQNPGWSRSQVEW